MATMSSGETIVPCPTCGVNLSIPASLATSLVACPICQTHVALASSPLPIDPVGGDASAVDASTRTTRESVRPPHKAMRYESMVLHGLLLLAAVSIAGYAIQRAVSPASTKTSSTTAPAPRAIVAPAAPSYEEGDLAVLTSTSRSEVFLAIHEADWDELIQAMAHLDKTKLAKLIVQGKIVSAPVGTRVSVVSPADRVTKRLKVRVEEKEAAGAEGWVELDWLHRDRPKPFAARAETSLAEAKSDAPASKDKVQLIVEPERPVRAPSDPQTDYSSGAAFDNPPQGMQTKNGRSSFQNPAQGPTRRPAPTLRRPPGMAPRGSAPNVPDPSFENPRAETPRPEMPVEKAQTPQ
jgi:hypothetical protein